MGQHKLSDEISDRILRIFELRDPLSYRKFWGGIDLGEFGAEGERVRWIWASLRVRDWEFRISYKKSIVVYSAQRGRSAVFYAGPNTPCDMDEHVCRNFLLPDLERELVLEDLSRV